MDVILQRDIPKLGKSGEIVHVKHGYARNYLFPRAYAVSATGGALKDHKARFDRENERGSMQLQTAQSDADKLQGLALTLIGKVGNGTKLYGSITAQYLSEAIARKNGVVVDKRRIGLADPIKNLGTFTVPVRLHSDISIAVAVEVITQEEMDRRTAQTAAAESAAAAEAAAAAASPTPDETPAEAGVIPASAV